MRSVVDVVSELPSLTHAQLSEPSIQLTALPVPYTTDYTCMHNSQHAHNISMPHYSPSFLSSSQFESCCGSDRTSCRPSPLSLLSGISTATHYIHTYYILYLISGRLTLHWCQKWDSSEVVGAAGVEMPRKGIRWGAAGVEIPRKGIRWGAAGVEMPREGIRWGAAGFWKYCGGAVTGLGE